MLSKIINQSVTAEHFSAAVRVVQNNLSLYPLYSEEVVFGACCVLLNDGRLESSSLANVRHATIDIHERRFLCLKFAIGVDKFDRIDFRTVVLDLAQGKLCALTVDDVVIYYVQFRHTVYLILDQANVRKIAKTVAAAEKMEDWEETNYELDESEVELRDLDGEEEEEKELDEEEEEDEEDEEEGEEEDEEEEEEEEEAEGTLGKGVGYEHS